MSHDILPTFGTLFRLQGEWALSTTSKAPARTAANNNTDNDRALIRWQEASSLAGQMNWSAVQRLIDYLGDDHPFVRWQAGLALAETAARLRSRARLGFPIWSRQAPELTFSSLLMRLNQSLHDADPGRRAATADALALWRHEVVANLLVEALERDSDPQVRASTAMALGKIGDKTAIRALIAALSDTSIWVQRAAADALGAIAAPEAVTALEQAMQNGQSLLKSSIVCALGHMPTARARAILAHCTEDEDPALRWYAARGLSAIGNTGSLPALQRLLEDQTTLFGQPLSEMAATAIETIERRERGLFNWLRKQFFALRRLLERK